MDVLGLMVLLLLAGGAGLAIHEWRKGKVLLKHDLNAGSPGQSEIDRDLLRAEDRLRDHRH